MGASFACLRKRPRPRLRHYLSGFTGVSSPTWNSCVGFVTLHDIILNRLDLLTAIFCFQILTEDVDLCHTLHNNWISEQQYFTALIAWNNIQIPLSITSKHCECHQRTLIDSLIGLNIRCSHYAHQGADILRCEPLPAVEVHFDEHAAAYGCNNRQHLYNNDEGLVKGMENEIRQPGPNLPPEKHTHKVWVCKADIQD